MTTISKLERDVRFLKVYAVAVTATVVAVLLSDSGASQVQRQKFVEIDVERLNVVDADGKLAMVIGNRQRLPGPIVGGKELARNLSQGRSRAAGILFVDVQGNEVGGLVYGATIQPDGTYSASSSLTFDQHNQDQVVGLSYADDGKLRSYGLNVWDRPTKISARELLELPGAASDRSLLEKRFVELMKERGETVTGARRVFVGSQGRTAAIRMMDTAGRERIRLVVDSTNQARMEFVDESGRVAYALPPR